jgi:hypothetical protein
LPHPRKKLPKSQAELRAEWRDELPPAIWRVQGKNRTAHFTCHKGKVIKAEPPIDQVVLGKSLMKALEACWDREWKTTLVDEG